MKLFENIRIKIGERILLRNHKTNKRIAVFHNLQSAKHINILFDGRTEQKFRKIKAFIKELEAEGKTVKALGFVEAEEQIGSFLYKKDVNFFSPKQINWYGKPDSEVIKAFINSKPDILLNFCFDDYFPARFITAGSQADFKISAIKNDAYADFIIDISDNKNIDVFIEQVKHYLQIIKRAENR